MDQLIATRLELGEWIRRRVAAHALSRRTLLGSVGALSGLTVLGCSNDASNSSAAGTTRTASTTTGTTAAAASTTTTTTTR